MVFVTFLIKYIMYFNQICSSPSLVTRFAGLPSQIRLWVYLFVCAYMCVCMHACLCMCVHVKI